MARLIVGVMGAPETEIIISRDSEVLVRRIVVPGDYVIGRAPECDIQVQADLVSRHHAKLSVHDHELFIEDLNSSNGTFVQGVQISQQVRIWPNQKIQIGVVTLKTHRVRVSGDSTQSITRQSASIARVLPAELRGDKKYDIGGVVAQGGMGAILNAREATIQRSVAMKVMLQSGSEEDLVRFVEEAQITGQLEHPNIVPVHELGVDEHEQVYYTMKFVKGITLKKVIELVGKDVPETVRKWHLAPMLTVFQKVCDAIAFAHSRNVIHRDLKPENVMTGDFGEVLVMDWGLAKVIGRRGAADAAWTAEMRTMVMSARQQEEGSMTLAGTIMGTPHYMSPEQAAGDVEALDQRTDVYSLGAILYHLLCLHPCVEGLNVTEILDNVRTGRLLPLVAPQPVANTVRNGRPQPLSHLPDGRIPESLAAVARKALALNPDDRYPSVAALQADIAAYQGGFATSAEHAGLGKQIALAICRHRREAIGLAAGLVLLIVLSVFFVLNLARERNRAEGALERLKAAAPSLVRDADTLLGEQKFPEALEKLEFAIDLQPRNPDYHLRRANLLQATLRMTEAQKAYRRVLQLRPGDATAKGNLALAEKLLLQQNGADSLPQSALGELYGALGDQGRMLEAVPLAERLGLGGEASLTLVQTKLEPLTKMPGWHSDRIRRVGDRVAVNLSDLPVTDLSILRGLPIHELSLNNVAVTDLRPIANLPLQVLNMSRVPAEDLSPLANLPLVRLAMTGLMATDFSVLSGRKFKTLRMHALRITNLDFLRGCEIEEIYLDNTGVLQNIEGISGLPLLVLSLGNCRSLEDLRPIASLQHLQYLIVPEHLRDLEVVRKLPKLLRLGNRPESAYGGRGGMPTVPEFWAEFTKMQEKTISNPEAIERAQSVLSREGFTNTEGRIKKSQNNAGLELELGGLQMNNFEWMRGMRSGSSICNAPGSAISLPSPTARCSKFSI